MLEVVKVAHSKTSIVLALLVAHIIMWTTHPCNEPKESPTNDHQDEMETILSLFEPISHLTNKFLPDGSKTRVICSFLHLSQLMGAGAHLTTVQ